MKKLLYPCAEELRHKSLTKKPLCGRDETPDFIGGKPNHKKFEKWSPEKTLAWLNID